MTARWSAFSAQAARRLPAGLRKPLFLLALLLLPALGLREAVRTVDQASRAPAPPSVSALDTSQEQIALGEQVLERIRERNLLALQLQPTAPQTAAGQEGGTDLMDGTPPPPLAQDEGRLAESPDPGMDTGMDTGMDSGLDPAMGDAPANATGGAPWIITGVVQGDVHSVFVTTGNATRVVFLDDELEGWRLTRIQGNRTTWARGGESRELQLQPSQSKGEAPPPQPPSPLPTLLRVQEGGGKGGQRSGATVSSAPTSVLPGTGGTPAPPLAAPGPVR